MGARVRECQGAWVVPRAPVPRALVRRGVRSRDSEIISAVPDACSAALSGPRRGAESPALHQHGKHAGSADSIWV